MCFFSRFLLLVFFPQRGLQVGHEKKKLEVHRSRMLSRRETFQGLLGLVLQRGSCSAWTLAAEIFTDNNTEAKGLWEPHQPAHTASGKTCAACRPWHGQHFWIFPQSTPLTLHGSLESFSSHLGSPLFPNRNKTSLFPVSSYQRFYWRGLTLSQTITASSRVGDPRRIWEG